MWTSNRGHIFSTASNVIVYVVMQKKRNGSKNHSLAKQLLLRCISVYYVYRDEILQRRILGAVASSYQDLSQMV